MRSENIPPCPIFNDPSLAQCRHRGRGRRKYADGTPAHHPELELLRMRTARTHKLARNFDWRSRIPDLQISLTRKPAQPRWRLVLRLNTHNRSTQREYLYAMFGVIQCEHLSEIGPRSYFTSSTNCHSTPQKRG